ncbi:uncharacterized protein LOC116849601 isoform X2 [Odontomachus brunneus]|uniref:uncharacterized protein LOC116849601 isoform X2 n=1 Tax=Odontomachus brunneus TaxID=486640 RepID=UPI0013F2A46E|nr:uncharacterized protein LOC116849601 isoform X2 [Odontomachus brunneus]
MSFLDDSMEQRKLNLLLHLLLEFSPFTMSSQSSSSPLTSYPESHNFSNPPKRFRQSTTVEDEILRGLSAFKPITPAATDSVDLFCRSIVDTLRELDLKSRLSMQIQIMQLLHDKF